MDRLEACGYRSYPWMLRATAPRVAEEPTYASDPLPRVSPAHCDDYIVRIPSLPQDLICPCCSAPFLAAGPTGFFRGLPLCDACLLERAPQLGMVLVLVAVVRAFGSRIVPGQPGEHSTLLELAAFARIYEGFARRHAPARGLEAFLRELDPDR